MSNMYPYTFDNMTRIGHDSCYTDQKDIQNSGYGNYVLQNYFANDCTMMKPIELATSQPAIMYNGGFGNLAVNGCNVDQSSKLLIGSIQTNNACKISLFQRPFVTCPFLGRGSVCPVLESNILQGEQIINKKSVNPLSEKNNYPTQTTPLLQTTKDRMDNYSTAIYANEQNGFYRGGMSVKNYYNDTSNMTAYATS